jgi:hypothetical protein
MGAYVAAPHALRTMGTRQPRVFQQPVKKTIRPGIVTILGADENKDVRPSVGVQILPLAADEVFLADSPRRPGAGQRPDAHFSTGERDARGEGYACGFS